MRNVLRNGCRENQNTFHVQHFFSQKIVPFMKLSAKYGRSRHATGDNVMRRRKETTFMSHN